MCRADSSGAACESNMTFTLLSDGFTGFGSQISGSEQFDKTQFCSRVRLPVWCLSACLTKGSCSFGNSSDSAKKVVIAVYTIPEHCRLAR